MYVVTNKQTGFKLYLNREQFNKFNYTTGKKLITLNKKFSKVYSVKKIKEYDTDKIFNELIYFVCLIMVFGLYLMLVSWS